MKKQKVYISSTFKDLKHLRELILRLFQNELSKQFELCKIMERMWDDGSQTPFVDECVREVKAADIYIVIMGNKVGSFPPNENRTFTEFELDAAIDCKKKMFCFRFTEFDPGEIDNPQKHAEILAKFDGKHAHLFSDENELELKLLKHLIPHIYSALHHTTKQLSLNVPACPIGFLGREEELRTIKEKLNGGGQLMLINAEGGIGKTTLAAKYWHDSLHEYKHAAWLFCGDGIVKALSDLAPQLNVDLSQYNTAEEQVEAIKRALHAVQNEFLLVLDNANDEQQIKIFRQTFEGFHWHVLITSRCNNVVHENQELHITHLPPPLAKELFERYYKEETPGFDALLERVLQAISYHTLLTEVFAKNLAEASEDGKMNLADFLNHLEEGGLYLNENSFEIGKNEWAEKRGKAKTDEILDALYNFSQLNTEETFVLLNLCLMPAESYTLPFLKILLDDDTTTPPRHIREALKALVKKGWVGENNRNYRISPLIQRLMLARQTALHDDALPLLNRLNSILECDAYNLTTIPLNNATPYIAIIPHLTRSLKDYPSWEIGSLNFSIGIYYNNIGNTVLQKEAWNNYQRVYQELLKKNPEDNDNKNGLAISYEKLGGIYEQTGDWKNALLNYQEQLRIFKEIYESSPENLSYKNGLAISYSKLGGIYEQTGDWKNALLNYQEQLRIFKEIYESSPENLSYKNGLAISYSKLGGIYEQTGDWKNALLNYQEQLRIFKEIYESSPETLSYKNGLAISYSKLGGIYEQTGDWKNALLNYQEQLRIFKEIYESSPENLSYKNGLAISYSKLGGIYEQTGDWKNALLNYQEQLRIFKEIYESSPENLSYKNGLAISYSKLGGIYEQTGDWKNALLNYQEQLRIFKEIYESSPETLSYKNGLAISYSKLGGIYEQTGDWKNALLNYEEDFRITKEIYESSPENLSYKNGLAISYEKLGGIYEQTGDWKNALLNYEEDFRITKEIYESSPENLSYKNGLAISYEKLGGIYEQTGDWKNALLNYEEYNRLEKEIVESSPETLSYKNGLAISYSKLGGIYEQTGDWKNALLNYEEYNRLEKEIVESSPETLSYKNGLAISYEKLGGIYEQTGDWKNALLNYEEYNRLEKEIVESSPENLSYKNGLAVSFARLGTFYLNQNQIGEALNHFLESRKLFGELWQATKGQILQFTFYFALNTRDVTRIVKVLIQNNQYPSEQIPEIATSIKAMRREGYAAIVPLADEGKLQTNQVSLVKELGDEGWYDF